MRNDRLLEVWNDTVDGHHLIGSLIIGGAVSLGAFQTAEWLLGMFIDDPRMARTYAMLFGIIGCVVGGAICAYLFRPKREVVEDTVDTENLQGVLAALYADYGSRGGVEDLPEAVRSELRELELEEAFLVYERDHAQGDAVAVTERDLGHAGREGVQS